MIFYTWKYGRMILLLVYDDDILMTGESQDDIQLAGDQGSS